MSVKQSAVCPLSFKRRSNPAKEVKKTRVGVQ